MVEVASGTIVVFADPGCAWAHAAMYGLHEARQRLGLEAVSFDIRAFPLELHNSRPTPKWILDAEVPVVGGAAPKAGWAVWHNALYRYPVTMLPAMEAVHAVKDQDLGVSDRFDRALRIAFFRESRCISMHEEIVSIGSSIQGLDPDRLDRDLQEGTYRRKVFDDFESSKSDEVKGSPHVFLPDGTDFHNPGIDMSWDDPKNGFPVIHSYDVSVYDDILVRAKV